MAFSFVPLMPSNKPSAERQPENGQGEFRQRQNNVQIRFQAALNRSNTACAIIAPDCTAASKVAG